MQKVLDNILCGIRATVFRRNTLALTLAVFAVLGVFLATSPAYAFEIQKYIAMSVAWLCFYIASFLGELLLILINALIWVAEYNGFAQSHAVANGWIIVRDVVNMFFIVVLLVIAFGTILGVEQYSYHNKRLTTLLLMAVVVNFSRTICGLLIDFAQVIMLTFVNGFSQAAGGNFIEAFGLTKIFQAGKIGTEGKSGDMVWGIALSMMLAMVMTLVALWVIITMIAVLVARIVYLWILIVLSPLAFFLKGVPGGGASKYYGEWWKKFTDQVVVGPVMAFILWLALVSVAAGGSEGLAGESQGFPAHRETKETKGFSEAFSNAEIEKFIIAIGLLLGGVQMAKSMSPVAGVVSGAVKARAQRAGMGVLKWAGRRAGRGAAALDRATGFRAARARAVPLTKAGAKRGAATLLSGLGAFRSSRQKVAMYRQMEDDARKAGKLEKADKYAGKAKKAEDLYKSRTTGGRLMEGAVGVLGAPAAALQRSAQEDIKKMRSQEQDEVSGYRKDIKGMSVEQKMAMAEGTAPTTDKNQQVAAVTELASEGVPELRGRIDEARELLVRVSADPASMEQFEADVRKHFPDEAKYIPTEPVDSDRNVAMREGQWSGGKMGPQLANVFDDANLERVDPGVREEYARQMAEAPPPSQKKMLGELSWPQQQNLRSELETIAKTQEPDPKLSEMIMQLAPPSPEDPREDAMEEAYGVSETGSFAGPHLEENKAAFTKSIGGMNADKMLANIHSSKLMSEDKPTEANNAVVSGLSNNFGALDRFARKVREDGSKEFQDKLAAIMEGIFQGDNVELQNYARRSRALMGYVPEGWSGRGRRKPKGGENVGDERGGGAADSGAREVDLPEDEGAPPEVDEEGPLPGGRGGRRGPAGGGEQGGGAPRGTSGT